MTDWPTHAYIPGETARHPDGAFDAIRDTATPGMTAEALANSEAFTQGFHYLDSGFYWEAHEVLEPVWMALPDGSDEKRFVQSVIQLANAALKARMGKPNAVIRLCGIARGHLDGINADAQVMGMTIGAMLQRIDAIENKIKHDNA